MTLRGIVRIYVVGAVALLAALLGASVAAASTLERATNTEARRSQSLRLADELRQTSDDLTRMARTYVVSGDRRYRDYLEEILAIRDGRAPRPEQYDRIYWDVVTSTGQRPRPFGPAVAYEVLAAEAGFTETARREAEATACVLRYRQMPSRPRLTLAGRGAAHRRRRRAIARTALASIPGREQSDARPSGG